MRCVYWKHKRIDAEVAPIFPQEPLTDPDVLNRQPDDMQNPQFYRREFDAYDVEGTSMIDLSKRYQSSAILNEYDLAARRRANDEMRTNPAYKSLEYGSIEYYKVYDDLVSQEKKSLRSKYGPPTCSFDGLTKLPSYLCTRKHCMTLQVSASIGVIAWRAHLDTSEIQSK